MTDETGIMEFAATTSLSDVLGTASAPGVLRMALRTAGRRLPVFGAVFMLAALGTLLSFPGDKAVLLGRFLTLQTLLQMVAVFALIFVMMALLGGAWRWVGWAITRHHCIDAWRAHPDVDRSSEALKLRRICRFDATGMTTTTPADETWESWSRISGLADTNDLLLVKIGRGNIVFPIPKAELSEDMRERLARFIAARAGAR